MSMVVSPLQDIDRVAMGLRALAAGFQIRSEFDGSGGQSFNAVANELLEWAERLESARAGLCERDDLSIPEQDDLHCPTCGKEWVWHGRDEKQRVCDECRFGE